MIHFGSAVCGALFGIVCMHVISGLFVKRDDKRRKIAAKEKFITLNEKCAYVLKLYGENKEIPDSVLEEIEQIIFSYIDAGLLYFYDTNKTANSSMLLYEYLKRIDQNSLTINQAIKAGQLLSLLSLLML